jgi:hypothetical protein
MLSANRLKHSVRVPLCRAVARRQRDHECHFVVAAPPRHSRMRMMAARCPSSVVIASPRVVRRRTRRNLARLQVAPSAGADFRTGPPGGAPRCQRKAPPAQSRSGRRNRQVEGVEGAVPIVVQPQAVLLLWRDVLRSASSSSRTGIGSRRPSSAGRPAGPSRSRTMVRRTRTPSRNACRLDSP